MSHRTLVLALAVALTGATTARADDDWFPPVTDPTVEAECGACHMTFQPSMLPARSWRAVMAGLDDHFGENATLDAATAKQIEDRLVAGAADAGGRAGEVLYRLSPDAVPLRISDTPWWQGEHDEVRAGAYEDSRVGSKANCVACHAAAARGSYEDD
jgi:hypothetical protein